MTGGEIIGGAAAAKGVGEIIKAAVPGAEDREQFREITKDSKATEVAAHARADRIAVVQMALTKLYAPLAKWVGYRSEYFETQFERDMAEKLADVPPDRLVSPQPIVAAQAMEGLGFSLDEPNLKEMYLNLLATASDSAQAHKAHPSFAQIIKELSAAEASLLLEVLDHPGLAVVEIRLNITEPTGWRTLHRNVIAVEDSVTHVQREDTDVAMYIDNWVRLGLINVDYRAKRVREGAYAWVEERPEMIRARATYDGATDVSVGFEEGIVETTALGLQFARAVEAPSATTAGDAARTPPPAAPRP